jgi:hypothetical protein
MGLGRKGIALLVSVGAGLVGGGSAWLAAADSGGAGGDCVVAYRADGVAAAFAQGLEVPLENLSGEPYTQAQLLDGPHSLAIASDNYKGFIGESVYGTSSGYLPEDPTRVDASYPEVKASESHDWHNWGAGAHTEAAALAYKSIADAKMANPNIGGAQGAAAHSQAHSEAIFDGSLFHGKNTAVSYDVNIGPLHIDFVRSEYLWSSDGTPEGLKDSWLVQFHGVDVSGKAVSAANENGFSFQDSPAQPGAASMKQLQQQEQQFSDAMYKAGAAGFQLIAAHDTRSIESSDNSVDFNGVGLEVRFAPAARSNNSGQALSWQFGRVFQHFGIQRGDCESSRFQNVPAEEAPAGGANPNLQQYPPKEDENYSGNAVTGKQQPVPPMKPDLPALPGGDTSGSASAPAGTPSLNGLLPSSPLPAGLWRMVGDVLPPSSPGGGPGSVPRAGLGG